MCHDRINVLINKNNMRSEFLFLIYVDKHWSHLAELQLNLHTQQKIQVN